jgi:hypothetical protein
MLTKSESSAEVYWIAFRGLPRADQRLVIKRIIGDKNLRRDEPARPLREYLAE